jgi:hypothetical protein
MYLLVTAISTKKNIEVEHTLHPQRSRQPAVAEAARAHPVLTAAAHAHLGGAEAA